MESAHKEPFAELKKLAARLDIEIANADNCLRCPVKSLPTSAITAFEQATTFEAQFKLLELRLQAVVKEKLASVQDMTDCLENAHFDNEDLLPKLLPLGFKVPDNVLPALQHMPLPSDQDSTDETSLRQPTVTKLEPVFSSIAMGSSHVSKPSQRPSQLSQRSLQLWNSKTASQSPDRPGSQAKSKLDRYLEEIEDNDTMLFLRRKPLPGEDFGAAANTASASHTPVKEPSEAFEFRGLMQALTDKTFTYGVESRPKTPEPEESVIEEEENKATWTKAEPKWKKSSSLTPTFVEHGATTFPKTPQLKESLTPVLKESNLGVPW